MELALWVAWIFLKGALVALLGLILYVVINPYHRYRVSHIPGPSYRPIFGNLPEIREIGSHEFMAQCHRRYGPVFKLWFGHRPWIVVCDPDLGKRVNYKLINRPARLGEPLIHGPAAKQENKGLFLSRDDHWRHLHRVWQPAFYADSVRACAPLMETITQRLLQRLDSLAATGQPLDMWREVGNLTMGIVGTAAYGIDFHTVDAQQATSDGPSAQAASVTRLLSSASNRLSGLFPAVVGAEEGLPLEEGDTGRMLIESAKVVLKSAAATSGSMYQMAAVLSPRVLLRPINLLAHLLPDARFKQVLQARIMLSSASMALVRQARKAAQQQQQQQQQQEGKGAGTATAAGGMGRAKGPVAPGSFLGLLLSARDKAGHGLTDLQMLMQANTFTLAGYETTANTLAFSLFCLATHPEAEDKVVKEIRTAAVEEAGAVAAAAAAGTPHTAWYSRSLEEQFPFTCAVISEALRLYPPGATTFRETAATPFELGPYTLPPQTTLVVASYVMQRDPQVWSHAHEFKPERWLSGHEDLAPKNPAAYLPFGSGGRQCIGQRFALQEARLGLVQLMQHFRYTIDWNLMTPAASSSKVAAEGVGADSSCRSSSRSLKVVNNFTLCPAGGIWVKLTRREVPQGVPLL